MFQKMYTSSVKSEFEKYIHTTYPLARLYPFKINDDKWGSGFSKALPFIKTNEVNDKLRFTNGDLVLVTTGKWDHAVSGIHKISILSHTTYIVISTPRLCFPLFERRIKIY